MPPKNTVLTDEERAKRIRETAREVRSSNSSKVLDEALRNCIVKPLKTQVSQA